MLLRGQRGLSWQQQNATERLRGRCPITVRLICWRQQYTLPRGSPPWNPVAQERFSPLREENKILGKRNRLWRGHIPIHGRFFCGRGHTFRRGRIKKREGKGRRKTEGTTGKNEKNRRGQGESGRKGCWKEEKRLAVTNFLVQSDGGMSDKRRASKMTSMQNILTEKRQ